MAEYKIMSPFEFYEETKKGREFTLLDVRTPEEFAGARMDYAINIPIDQLEERIKAVTRGKPVLCICRTGARSAVAAEILARNGFDAYNLDGGMVDWNIAQHVKKEISDEEYAERREILKQH